MKPLNLDNSPCSPISSNCVIWQGPDLACIKLCKGDTVSDVVAKLATELCTILDQLNVDNYDLTCFNSSACPPVDFQALIQFLISHICALENTNVVTVTTLNPTNTTETIYPTKTPQSSTCPDCVVSIAPCFVIGTQTTMQLTDYVTMIAERVCGLIDTINTQQIQINNIDGRVTALENVVPTPFTLPSIIVNCTLSATVLGGIAYPIDTVLNALINDSGNGYCSLISSTGLPADLFSAVSSQCISSSSPTLTNAPVPFGTEYLGTWVNTPTTVANSITNLWISLCDIYTYLSTALPTTIVTQGDGITVTTTIVGSATTYEVSANVKPGLSAYIGPPSDLVKIAPGLNTGRLCDAPTQVLNLVEYNDFGVAYDITTGIFTVPATGRYTISFFSHFTRNVDDGWYDASVLGMWTAGIVSPTGCNFYCINNDSVIQTQKHASINGSITKELTIGTQICVKVLNLTNFDYISFVGDGVRFGVQRVD